MQLTITSRHNYTILEPREEIGLNNSQDFKKKMTHLIESSESNIIIDLQHMAYADSMLIGCLIFAMKKLRNLNRDLLLVNVDPAVIKTLKTTNIDHHFRIISSIEDV